MKKIFMGLVLIVALSFTLVGCGKSFEKKEAEVIALYHEKGKDVAIAKAEELFSEREERYEVTQKVRLMEIESMASALGVGLEYDEYGEMKIAEPEESMEITEHTSSTKDDSVYIKGYVKNISSKTIRYYEVLGTINNSNGDVLDSGRDNSGTDLRPDDSRSFEIRINNHKDFSKYSARIGDVSFK